MAQGRIVLGADGKHYREVPLGESGDFEYIPIADVQVHKQQIEDTSHQDFFRNQKQKVRRSEALSKAVLDAAQRVEPGAHGSVRQVKDEEFFRLNKMYQDAYLKGEHKQCPFQPLSTYQHKLTPKIRPILAGEIGVYGAEILTLEPGYGKGQLVQVSAQLVPGEVKEIIIDVGFENVRGDESGGQSETSPGTDGDARQDGSVQRSEDQLYAPTSGDAGDA